MHRIWRHTKRVWSIYVYNIIAENKEDLSNKMIKKYPKETKIVTLIQQCNQNVKLLKINFSQFFLH